MQPLTLTINRRNPKSKKQEMVIPPFKIRNETLFDTVRRWYHETRIMIRTETPRPVEVVLALYKMLFGTWMLLSPDAYGFSPEIYRAVDYFSREIWGLLFLGLGLLQYYASAINRSVKLRQIVMVPTFLVFVIVTFSFLKETCHNPELWKAFALFFYFGISLLAQWCLYRLWSFDHQPEFLERIIDEADELFENNNEEDFFSERSTDANNDDTLRIH